MKQTSVKGDTIMRFLKFLALAALPLLTTPAAASDDAPQFRDLTVEQADVAQAGIPCRCSLKVSLAADRADWTYAIGETVGLLLTTNQDAYVTVLAIGPTGRVSRLFPNSQQPDNHLFANRPVEIGGGSSPARVAATGEAGAELIKVIASSRPVPVIHESQLQGRGSFRTVAGGVETLMRDLQVVGDQATHGEIPLAVLNVVLRTVTSAPRAPAAFVVPGQPAGPQAMFMDQP
jgi:Domain of unknown function (DUF4384)